MSLMNEQLGLLELLDGKWEDFYQSSEKGNPDFLVLDPMSYTNLREELGYHYDEDVIDFNGIPIAVTLTDYEIIEFV